MESVFARSRGSLVARLLVLVSPLLAATAGTVLPAAVVTAGLAVTPSIAHAQDEDVDAGGATDGGGGGGQSLLAFFFNALGIRYTVVFLAISFSLVALVVMCGLMLRRSLLIPPGLSEAFEAHLDAKQYPQAFELVKADDSYLGKQLAAGMGKLSAGYPQAVEAMQDSAADDTMRMEHKISYVALVGALAPMFGLLGTVDGMVSSFMTIAQASTAPKPKDLAMGIATALITTLVGLWLAIPAIAAFALFKNWLQRLTADGDAEAMRLMGRFQGVAKK